MNSNPENSVSIRVGRRRSQWMFREETVTLPTVTLSQPDLSSVQGFKDAVLFRPCRAGIFQATPVKFRASGATHDHTQELPALYLVMLRVPGGAKN